MSKKTSIFDTQKTRLFFVQLEYFLAFSQFVQQHLVREETENLSVKKALEENNIFGDEDVNVGLSEFILIKRGVS